jgi:glyoxylase-like metal-dependent hydrolase (beta-lactamase superfamily II)
MVPGKCESVGQGVRRILAGNAGLMTGPGTNTYLLGEREVAVLDPGPDEPRHLEAILAAAGPAIRWIVATHSHPDHSPLVSRLAQRTGAQIIGLPLPRTADRTRLLHPILPGDGDARRSGSAA